MIVALTIGCSVSFAFGMAWGSASARRRLVGYMYQHPDIGEAIRRAERRSR